MEREKQKRQSNQKSLSKIGNEHTTRKSNIYR